MSSKSIKTLSVLVVCVFTAAGLFAVAEAGPKSGSPAGDSAQAYKPAQKLEQMMEGQKKLFGEIKAGILDESWDDAIIKTWILAEVANANQFQNSHAKYKKLASRMSEQCADLASTLKKHDSKAAMQKFSAVGKTCGACHDQFGKKH